MAARVIWKPSDLVSIKLREDLYTIGQMLTSPAMRFFDISNNNGEWEHIDLNNIEILFQVFVGKVVNKNLVEKKITNPSIIASTKPYQRYWISPYTIMDDGHYKGNTGSFHFLGGKLIDLGPEGKISTSSAPIIKEDLSLPQDRKLILQYELDNMWGSEDLRERLCRYFETGINRDDLKFEVFPGLWSDRDNLRPLTSRLPVPLR